MIPSKPYTSKDVAQLVNQWQICCFFNLLTDTPIITISSFELYRKNSKMRCAPEAVEKIKAALKKAYEEGVRSIGMFAPYELRMELMDAALSITDDPTWLVYPRHELAYIRDMLTTKAKLTEKAYVDASTTTLLTEMEKQICNALGFTDEVLIELVKYKDVENVEDLPPHLRVLFADGVSPESQS